ncbi:MAG: FeoB-associated Cys-rich membrane protein [bacterium]|nr:FeoB-associated Cys-rich membrane protein [bacterium]
MINILILAGIAAAFLAAVIKKYKDVRDGKGCCSSCSGCSRKGNCQGRD